MTNYREILRLHSVIVIRAPLQGLHCAGRDANA